MDTYEVNNYSDEQLYDILDMNNPTDRELEAKIIQMMRKYENIPTHIGKQLYAFFDNMYKRFFDTESDEEYDENLIEGFGPANIVDPSMTTPPTGPTTKEIGYTAQNISSVQQFNYSPDKLQLNPLLQQTIKRVISIDSQYRNIMTYPNTTNFSFDLSEPLRDVVSLKLYSVQIPYTWYTVGKSYGSNFFYLRGNSPGIVDQNYKIAIPPGNYNQTTLINTINESFQDISNGTASDINFNGQPLLTYNSSTARTTVNLNMTNTFNETYYTLNFPYFTHPLDLSNAKYSIPGYLGFNNQTYFMNSINSNQNYRNTESITTEYSQNFTLDNSNNYFTVIQYLGYDSSSGYDSRSQILNTFKIQLTNNGLPYTGPATRQNVINTVNQALIDSPYFDSSSKIQAVPITDIKAQNYGYTYFQLSIIPNRSMVKYVPNSKILVIFPNESPKLNQYNELYTIWQLQPGLFTSCFYFDNVINEFSEFISETPAIQSTFEVDLSTNILMTCKTQGFIEDSNNYKLRIPSGIYNVSQFLNQINTSFSNQNTVTPPYFNMVNTNAFLDSSNYFHLQIDLTRSFTNHNYKSLIDDSTLLLSPPSTKNFDISFSIVNTTPPQRLIQDASYNLYDISYINITLNKQSIGYDMRDVSCIMYIKPDIQTYENGGNGGSDTIAVCIPPLNYPTYQSFLVAFQSAFTSTIYTTPISTQNPLSKTTITTNTSYTDHIDISLNLNCYYYLTEQNYDVSFINTPYSMSNTKNVWNPFNIYSRYDLSKNVAAGYADIVGYNPVKDSITQSITLYDNSNNTLTFSTNDPKAPSETITIDISSGTYTTVPLYAAINKALSNNPRTYGSYIQSFIQNNQEYSYLWININHVYTTQDYILDFYDPVNFVSCYVGTTSVQNTTWDSTIGWMLGFRDYTQYVLIPSNQTTVRTNSGPSSYYLQSSNGSYNTTINYTNGLITSVVVELTGDTSLSTNLYNYFLISLDDFIQNHLNDGLVTITRSQTSIQIPDYAYSTTQANSDNVTQNQLYAQNQAIISQQPSTKEYSPGPFIKDLFGIIPIKPPSNPGDYYTEFGGTLQNQERLYFGPVNIRKMSIQLLTDRGTVVDLNNSNWSFSFVCEQLYRASST